MGEITTVSGNSAKPWTRWWWMGNAVEEKELTRHLETYSKAGIGGVEISCIYGVKGEEGSYIEFLSPQWRHLVRYTLKEAQRLGLGVDITLGSGWPYGGPMISEKNAPKRIKIERHEDGSFSSEVEGTGQQVKRPAPGAEGHVMCPYTENALKEFTDAYKTFLSELEEYPRCFFCDSFEVYQADWTDDLPEKFKELKGYDISAHLAELSGKDSSEAAERVFCDYRETLFLMLLENSIKPWADWAHSHNVKVRYQAHGSPGNLLDLYAAADIPETEIFGGNNFDFLPEPAEGIRAIPASCPILNKFASSAAHLTGKRLASSETFTLHREHFCGTLAEMKPELDQLFLCGINHIFFHGSTYSPLSAKQWPGWKFYAPTHFDISDPLWHDLPAMNSYICRCQNIFQNARMENEILLYFPYHDMASKPGERQLRCSTQLDRWLDGTPFGETAFMLWENGFSADYISDRLLEKASVIDGVIRIADARYKILLIPKTVFMPSETIKKLIELADKGASIIFCDTLPKSTPGYFGSVHKFSGMETVNNASLCGRLLKIISRPCPPPISGGINTVKLRTEDGKRIYFASNLSAKSFAEDFKLDFDSEKTLIFDPLSNLRGYLNPDKQRSIHIELKAGQSLFIIETESPDKTPQWHWMHENRKSLLKQKGAWKIEFIDGGEKIPEKVNLDTLVSWTEFPGQEYKDFSGTARYSTEFEWNEKDCDEAILQFEKVHESAVIRINGHECGTLWSHPFELRAGRYLKHGVNKLEIDVTNAATNRVAALDRAGVSWKIFHDINIINLQYKAFDASGWGPRPSGIIGNIWLSPSMKRMAL